MRSVFFNMAIAILFLSSIAKTGNAQWKNGANEREDSDYVKVMNPIPPLDTLIQSTLKNSPLLKLSDSDLQEILEKIKIEKKAWTDYVFIEGLTRYGQYNQLIVNDPVSASATEYGVKTANQQLTYYGGITVKLPISSLISRSSQLRVLKNNLVKTQYQKEQVQIDLKRLVIEEYYKLLNYGQLMRINQEVFQALNISYLKAMKDAANGLIEMSDLSNIMISKGKAEEAYYNAKSDYFIQHDKLEVLTGFKFDTTK
jgi:outer membrane protein TolC